MKLNELTSYLEAIAPLSFQESYDNSGLLVGDPTKDISRGLIALDCTEEVVDEAIRLQCDVIIVHHPIIFKGVKKLTGANYMERVVIKAIRHQMAIYAIHTNLDNIVGGVNTKIADKLGLEKQRILAPKKSLVRKLVVFVPVDHVDPFRAALFAAGAGNIGDYSECSFNSVGYGTFKPGASADPFVGETDKQHREEEVRVEFLYPSYLEQKILNALYEAHPYDVPAYDIIPLENNHLEVGGGVVGELTDAISLIDFFELTKRKLDVKMIRHTAQIKDKVQRIAVCGGSGSFLLKEAIRAGADVFLSADFKYHEFFDAEDKIVIADVGHFESEQFTQELLLEIIRKKFTTFAVRLTGIDTNPIKYYS